LLLQKLRIVNVHLKHPNFGNTCVLRRLLFFKTFAFHAELGVKTITKQVHYRPLKMHGHVASQPCETFKHGHSLYCSILSFEGFIGISGGTMMRVLFSPFLYKINFLMRVNATRTHWRASIKILQLLHYLQHTFALK